MNKKLIFFDIDGTLISHAGGSHVPELTAEAVKGLKRNGHTPAIATARNWVLTRKTAAFFGIDLLVCCNGAYVAWGDNSRETHLTEEFTRVFCAKAPSLPSYALSTKNVYTEMNGDDFEAFIIDQAGCNCKKNIAAAEQIQLACIFAPLSPQWEWGKYEGIDIIETPRSTEFRPSGVSKWSGILTVTAAAGFEIEDVITIGDGLNDMDMVRNAPLGLAVGGAHVKLKEVADLVTEDIDKGGIFSAFRKLDLI